MPWEPMENCEQAVCRLLIPTVLEQEVEVEWLRDIGRIVSAGAGADFDELERQDVMDHFQFGLWANIRAQLSAAST